MPRLSSYILFATLALSSCGGEISPPPADFLSQGGTSQGRFMVAPSQGISTEQLLNYLSGRRGFAPGTFSSSSLANSFSLRRFEAVKLVGMELTDADFAALARSGLARYVHPVRPVRMFTVQKNPPSWGLDRIDQRNLPLDARFAYPNESGAGVWAFVIDTGIDVSHSEFRGRSRQGFTSIDDGQGTFDCEGHGTHVAGTIAGSTYGTARNATVIPVRVLSCEGRGSDEGVVAGINWVIEQKKANPRVPMVANMSIGGDPSPSLDEASTKMVEAGIFLAVAAGNDSQDACDVSPARVPAAVTVGATGKTDAQSYFSNFGSCVDIYAPGEAIRSSIPGNRTSHLSGTSMASPHTCGVGAQILALNPSWSPQQVKNRLYAMAVTGAIKGVQTAHPSNRLLQSEAETAQPAPDPTPTPAPQPPPVDERIYTGSLLQYGVKTIFMGASSLPSGKISVEGILSGPTGTNFNVSLKYWDTQRKIWADGPSGNGSTSNENITWTGDVTNLEWKISNAGRISGEFKLVVKFRNAQNSSTVP